MNLKLYEVNLLSRSAVLSPIVSFMLAEDMRFMVQMQKN